ncbi:MAG: sugar ABC transporter permease [Clostridia bacterium]|nr:sugar ABC transporter permease [Clostridia bacterium]
MQLSLTGRVKKNSLQRRMVLLAWAFILPVLLVRVFTTVYPVIQVFYYSLLDYDLINRTKEFTGLTNFAKIFSDVTVQQGIGFTVEYTLCSLALIIVLGIMLALLMKFEFRGRKLIRTTALLPWGMPMIIICMAGRWMFNDTYSIINDMIRRVFAPNFHYSWLSETNGAKAAAIILNVWKNTPFFAIMLLAAMQGIPDELYEAARIDGANGVQILFRIMLPYVMKTMVMTIIFVGVGQINSFDIAYAMTRGGPGSSTALIAYRLYLVATKNMDYGYASALSVVMFTFTAIFGGIGLFAHNRIDY